MNDIKISFLIPSKNRLDLLKKAIESITVQDDQNFEIIVSDNSSTEDYESYIKSLNTPRVIYDRLSHPVSVTENWQNAYAKCSGDYVLMLGDDDALAPNFFKETRPYLTENFDVIYLSAYHYAYPQVIMTRPEGYLAVVRNAEFLQGGCGEFCLLPNYARELASAVFDFRSRIGFNAQHLLVNTTFASQFEKLGGIYQSPYPDTFSLILNLSHANKILVIPKEVIIIGISPKSFGAYYFSHRFKEGYDFLNNKTSEVQESLVEELLPGDPNNTNWLLSAETARLKCTMFKEECVNIKRYRLLQIFFTLKNYCSTVGTNKTDIIEFKQRLSPAEKDIFEFIECVLIAAAKESQDSLLRAIDSIRKGLGQFTLAEIQFLSIGEHKSIVDAYQWLKCQEK